jgi:hypothetical protein
LPKRLEGACRENILRAIADEFQLAFAASKKEESVF